MCGIAAAFDKNGVSKFLTNAITSLEYRGYDSCGVAIANNLFKDGHINSKHFCGKKDKNFSITFEGEAGIAHTRWATHGEASIKNAHPIKCGKGKEDEVWVVHNGIITNYEQLKKELEQESYIFNTETDSEVIGHLYSKACNLYIYCLERVAYVCSRIKGQYAFALLTYLNKAPIILAACDGSPLYLSGHKLCSDAAVLKQTGSPIYKIPDEHGAFIYDDASLAQIFSLSSRKEIDNHSSLKIQLNNHVENVDNHTMLTEIHEQGNEKIIKLPKHIGLSKKFVLFGCGSSYNAALVGKKYIEDIAKIPCEVHYSVNLEDNKIFGEKFEATVFIAISQSGETKDTFSAVNAIEKQLKPVDKVWCVTNQDWSALAQKVKNTGGGVINMGCGPEIAVASTKSFTSTCLLLYKLANKLAYKKQSIRQLHIAIKELFETEKEIKNLARKLYWYKNMIFLGRDLNYSIAKEAALKVKEVSYIHAEAIFSSEIKHGPIALVDDNTLSVFIVDKFDVSKSYLDNMNEIKSRKGKILVVGDRETVEETAKYADYKIAIPNRCNQHITPLLLNISLQLFAYYLSIAKGLNPDRPRSLAKCVTV